ncbi:MAG: LuxR C-terminal-related transcriptional regulator [Solirubrobacteraceae bacterium]
MHAPPLQDRALRRAVAEVMERAVVLGIVPDDRPAPIDVDGARTVLEQLATTLLRDGVRVGLGASARRALLELALDVEELRRCVGRDEERVRSAGLADARGALATLRGAMTIAQLVGRVPTVVRTLGFDRAMVSDIRRSMFAPNACDLGDDPERDAALLRVARDHPRRLDHTLRETEIVRRRTALLVAARPGDPTIHGPLAELTGTRHYVAVPLVAHGRVIGFVHADHHAKQRRVSRLDRDLLWTFADGVGAVVERLRVEDRLAGVETAVRRATRLADSALRNARGDDLDLGFGRDPAAEHGPARPVSVHEPGTADVLAGGREVADPLTRREVEVLHLMAAGETNAGIAARLVVSPGTAKTHVKNILRKLCAANRAEAVARYHQLLASEAQRAAVA